MNGTMSSMGNSAKRDHVGAWLDHGRSPRATTPVRALLCDNRLVLDGVRWTQRGTAADPGRGVEDFALVVVGHQDEDVLRRVLGGSRQGQRGAAGAGAAGAGAAGAERSHDIHRHVLPAHRRGDLPPGQQHDDGEGD